MADGDRALAVDRERTVGRIVGTGIVAAAGVR
jgi:hypothetical protein